MTKTYQLEDLEPAPTAPPRWKTPARRSTAWTSATISFMTQKLTLSAADDKFDDVLKQVVKTCKKVEPDCTILL